MVHISNHLPKLILSSPVEAEAGYVAVIIMAPGHLGTPPVTTRCGHMTVFSVESGSAVGHSQTSVQSTVHCSSITLSTLQEP